MKKAVKKAIPESAKTYGKQLLDEINQDRESHGKKPFNDNNGKPPREKVVIQSKTYPECGIFHKGEHKKYFAYAAQTANSGDLRPPQGNGRAGVRRRKGKMRHAIYTSLRLDPKSRSGQA